MRKHNLETHHAPESVIDETGNQYGRLKVIEFAKVEDGHALWLCKHEDGRTVLKRGTDLRNGNATGRCPGREEGEAAFRHLYRVYKHGAKERDLELSISKDLFRELTEEKCHYCGAEPSKTAGNKHQQLNGNYTYNGLDRVANSKGYTQSNVVPCCFTCNKMKGTMNRGKFLNQIESIKKMSFENYKLCRLLSKKSDNNRPYGQKEFLQTCLTRDIDNQKEAKRQTGRDTTVY